MILSIYSSHKNASVIDKMRVRARTKNGLRRAARDLAFGHKLRHFDYVVKTVTEQVILSKTSDYEEVVNV